MIEYTPIPVLFELGPIRIFSWGFIVAIGFLIGGYLAIRQGRKQGYKEDNLVELLTYILLGAIIGSRVFYVISDIGFFIKNPLEILAVWHGGMTSYGGIIGSIAAFYLCCRKNKLSFFKMVDLFAPYVALGLMIGRIGCFINWDDYGIASSLPWAVKVGSDAARHPTQIYMAMADLINFIVLLNLRNVEWFKKNAGSIFFSFLFIYGFFRTFIDMIRDYSLQGLIVSRTILILFMVVSMIFFVRKFSKKKV